MLTKLEVDSISMCIRDCLWEQAHGQISIKLINQEMYNLVVNQIWDICITSVKRRIVGSLNVN